MKLKLCSAIGIIALVAPGVVPMAVPQRCRVPSSNACRRVRCIPVSCAWSSG